jgi:hypothetical protein
MDSLDKPMFRAAVLLQAHTACRGVRADALYLPVGSWDYIQHIKRQIDVAQNRGWRGAQKVLLDDLADALKRFQWEIESAARAAEAHRQPRRVFCVSDIYRDLLALAHEFEDVQVDCKTHEIVVTTHEITLEDVYLGAFEIRLNWYDLGRVSPPYRVVALNPQPARCNDGVTHPHVQDGHLCEGEGRTTIAAALAECRLLDFFLLVSQILHTYGQGSAYVELRDWTGEPCSDCGESVDGDDAYCCNHCDATLCASCALSCSDCESTHCAGCLSPCSGCHRDFCCGCLATCPTCHREFCDACREGRQCVSCYKKQHPEENEEDNDDSSHDDDYESTAGPRCEAAAAMA